MTFDQLSPSYFLDSAIDEQTVQFNARLEETLSKLPPTESVPPQVTRAARDSGESLWGPVITMDEVEERIIPGSDYNVPVRVYVPDKVDGVYLHIHGGGFVLGRAGYTDPICVRLGDSCNMAVVSVDYRLAPEHPYPKGPDDCQTVAEWLLKNAKAEFGSDRLVVGGESAGGCLSAVTLLRLRERHGQTGFCGANLIYGAYDLSLTPSGRNWGNRRLVLTTPLLKWFNEQYAGSDRLTDPDVSPLYANLQNLPPALFSIGTQDPLLDDSLFMHAKWIAAGNNAELAIYPGGVHGFDFFPIDLAERANLKKEDFIRRVVAGSV